MKLEYIEKKEFVILPVNHGNWSLKLVIVVAFINIIALIICIKVTQGYFMSNRLNYRRNHIRMNQIVERARLR